MEMPAKEIQNRLLGWYDQNKRDLPWRVSTHPYSVWISEIMAQQTRIATLLPYYERFIKRFPTVFDLAAAPEDDVLKAWEGLGYYSRARNLRNAAQRIVSEWSGIIPDTKKELLSLPGIGDYTAGAILSIAYEVPMPAVDGNVLRIFSRLTNSDKDVAQPQTKELAKQFVASVLPSTRVGCFTQALMELGALICVPKNPQCVACPLEPLCRAKQCGRQSKLPIKSAKHKKETISQTLFIICTSDGRIVMRKRSEKLLNGLWEFYRVEGCFDEEAVTEHLNELGYMVSSITSMGKSKHVFTHIIWEMEGFFCEVCEQHAPSGYDLFKPSELKNLAIPTAIRKYTELYL